MQEIISNSLEEKKKIYFEKQSGNKDSHIYNKMIVHIVYSQLYTT